MLTPEQIDALRDKAGQLVDPVVEFLITDIAQRVAEAGEITSTAAYEIWRAQRLGLSLREVQEAAGAIPVTGIVELSARKAANSTRSGKIGVIATAATIRSGAFGNAVRRYLPDAAVTEKACPLFVPLVEDGRIHPGEPLIELCAREYLAPMQEAGVDTLILGCTHYPLLLDVIRGIMGPDVTLVNPGEETALYISRELTARNMLSGRNDGGSQRYFITDNSEKFGSVASLFLGRDAGQFVTHTDITE